MRNPFIITALIASLAMQTLAVGGEGTAALQYANIQLNEQGFLEGQVVEPTGAPVSAASVQMTDGHRTYAAITDSDGRFRFQVSACRTCILKMGDRYYGCRVWKRTTAPKGALTSIALVNDDSQVTRGNLFDRFRRRPAGPHTSHLSSDAKYGLVLLAGGGIAAYMALSRDNGS
ncbi:MAG: carboxypeptidase-like regulatory domain-containing protein [Planctomycetaceae bacterium]|nr:carboxypeptidase-like regulatory domain-containing protein [Planctomycetaceae bacterium]